MSFSIRDCFFILDWSWGFIHLDTLNLEGDCSRQRDFENYSGDQNIGLVQISNGGKLFGCQMVWLKNAV